MKSLARCRVCSLWKRDHVTISKQYLEMFQRNPDEFLRRFITVDETWIHYQVYKYEMTIFFSKKHIKFGRMIKRDLFKVCFIASYTFFPSFGQFVDTMPVKIFPFCREPFIEPFFHILNQTHTNQSAIQQVRDLSMQTNSNRKEPSLVSKP